MTSREPTRKQDAAPTRRLVVPPNAVPPFGITPLSLPLSALSQQDRQQLASTLEAQVGRKDSKLTQFQIFELRHYAVLLRSATVRALPMVQKRRGALDRRDPEQPRRGEEVDPTRPFQWSDLFRLLGEVGLDDVLSRYTSVLDRAFEKVFGFDPDLKLETLAPTGTVQPEAEEPDGAAPEAEHGKDQYKPDGGTAVVSGRFP
ncbi:hypothetical protein NLX83_33475 [Allokutzneria sp. A3M-2-11 16]|uniref:hypothetical protein n=1 Tax=Allokutzneria sp. A3M-2-11 16 TaxID=2962043 RepID=UPI0020B79D88|nr:hypothetical protein [Allokutzneria sp. A3M-2-11 16]MCP3804195.1 hypothetical protein [Allokutzneria sp. A3M-2-11 16]